MIDGVRAQLRKGVVEYCILGALEREPMYGWQLAETLAKPGLIASIGTLYPVLGRLRERGLITAFERSSGAGPVRKYYQVTKAGSAELDGFRQQWAPFTRAVSEMVGEVDDDKN
ncbi:PadR family transcriptional regulator [Agromyces aureus]|uniref:PadR family transcriptional regulator n=1 Tax=Agromyces aureus TaxID=453304 RepID=A0A191WLF8_9MICO|nr:PadR family transcriptional regulator [Agromyces aureus]ANJ29066.1 PadR family transcriptional regulator [Agromyces aureus]